MALVNGTKLGYSTSGTAPITYTDLPGLKSVPDLGGDPELVDNTALTDTILHKEIGIGDPGDMEYTFRYTASAYNTAVAREGKVTYFEHKLKDGSTFTFSGYPHIVLSGGGVNDPLEFTISIALNSDITASIASA